MGKPITIGTKKYKFKKDAIVYYRSILNSYNFEQSLRDDHYDDLIDLLNFNNLIEIELRGEESQTEVNNEIANSESNEEEVFIEDIKVSKVQFNTKCFEVFYSDNSSQYISYLMIINGTSYTPERLFYVACRNAIHNDINTVKQGFFDKNSICGQVKCQETNILSKWTELVVDHRQPNTFSVIVDRFKELNAIDLEKVEYSSSSQNHIIFKDNTWTEKFRQYHKEKASLRIVRVECNLRRTGMARLKRTPKDLTIR